MKVSTRSALALLAVLATASQASAGSATLADLAGGGSLQSDVGTLIFSNFSFQSNVGGISADDITVLTLDDGIRFVSPTAFAPAGTSIDYLISYNVAAVDGCLITSASMTSVGAGSGQGFIAIAELVEDGSSNGLGDLLNSFGSVGTDANDSIDFEGQTSVNVNNNFGLVGTSFLSDADQTFGVTCDDPVDVPTPTAALAGIALLGLVSRRRRGV